NNKAERTGDQKDAASDESPPRAIGKPNRLVEEIKAQDGGTQTNQGNYVTNIVQAIAAVVNVCVTISLAIFTARLARFARDQVAVTDNQLKEMKAQNDTTRQQIELAREELTHLEASGQQT